MDRHATKVLPKMSLDEARSVIWPFNEVKGQPIGSLLDKGVLSLRDMGFAVQRAYDKRVREAARTILLNALSEAQVAPENAPGPLNVVSTERRSYAERRQLKLARWEGWLQEFWSRSPSICVWRWLYGVTRPDNLREHWRYNQQPGGIIALVIACDYISCDWLCGDPNNWQ